MNPLSLIFGLLLVYQIKHWLCDYPLQTRFMLGKFKPGWSFALPLAAHAGIHAAFTFAIVNVATAWATHRENIVFAVAAAIFDFIVHFTMDRIKASPALMGRWKPLTASDFLQCEKEANYCSDTGIILAARKKLRDNTLFWWALGLDREGDQHRNPLRTSRRFEARYSDLSKFNCETAVWGEVAANPWLLSSEDILADDYMVVTVAYINELRGL